MFAIGLVNVSPAVSDAEDTKPRVGVVTATTLNIRAKPARHFEVIGQIRKGDEVQVVDENDEWVQILVNAQAKAWIAARFIGDDMAVTADRVRVHSGPGLVFTTYAYTEKGAKVTPVGPPVDGWQQIEPPDGAAAWVSRAYVQIAPPPEPEQLEPTEQTVVAQADDGTDSGAAGKDNVSPETVVGGEPVDASQQGA